MKNVGGMSKKFDEYAEEARKKKESLQKLQDWKNKKKTEELRNKNKFLNMKKNKKRVLPYLPMGQTKTIIVEKIISSADTIQGDTDKMHFDEDYNTFILES